MSCEWGILYYFVLFRSLFENVRLFTKWNKQFIFEWLIWLITNNININIKGYLK